MFLEKKGTVLIQPAPGSSIRTATALVCDKITNARIVRVDPVAQYSTRYGQVGSCQTVIAEDLDIPGHTHRMTVYKENVEKFSPQFVVGAVIEAQGLRGKFFSFNLLDLKVLKAPPAPAVAQASSPAPAEQTTESAA